MKKIPTLFVRKFDEHHNKTITREVTAGMEWVLAGEGVATIKIDGSCCAMIDGNLSPVRCEKRKAATGKRNSML